MLEKSKGGMEAGRMERKCGYKEGRNKGRKKRREG